VALLLLGIGSMVFGGVDVLRLFTTKAFRTPTS
jgi:hypothetical protein